jgi:hypothetical protein
MIIFQNQAVMVNEPAAGGGSIGLKMETLPGISCVK